MIGKYFIYKYLDSNQRVPGSSPGGETGRILFLFSEKDFCISSYQDEKFIPIPSSREREALAGRLTNSHFHHIFRWGFVTPDSGQMENPVNESTLFLF